MKHPIAKLLEKGFDHFLSLVRKEAELGNVDTTRLGDLLLADYSRQCQFDDAYNEVSEVCRGLILDVRNKNIVALPLQKFWNLSQHGTTFKNLPYSCTEKMDGSMGVIWFYDDRWNVSTRGSFSSPQAIRGLEILKAKYPRFFVCAHPKITYVVEVIFPENRIVVDYGKQEKLVLLAAFDTETYEELDDDVLDVFAEASGLERPKKYQFKSFIELESVVRSQKVKEHGEGVVIRFSDGSRLKLKNSEYELQHKLISHFSPLAVWETVKNGVEMEYIKELPDEFQEQYKVWKAKFLDEANKIWSDVLAIYGATKHSTDKELGIRGQSGEFGDKTGMVFNVRRYGPELKGDRARRWVFEKFKPKNNDMKRFEE